MNTRQEVFKLINEERAYQDERWNSATTASGGFHTPEEWLVYMQDYLTEAMHVASRKNIQTAYPEVMSIIRKITAMGVAAMEQHDTPERQIRPYTRSME